MNEHRAAAPQSTDSLPHDGSGPQSTIGHTSDSRATAAYSAPNPNSSEDFGSLFRRRLVTLTYVAVFGLGIAVLNLFIQDPNPSHEQWLVSRGPMLALLAGAALIAARIPRTTDVTRLRRWEYAVGATMLGLCIFHYYDSAYDPPRMAQFAERGILDFKVLARYLAMPWTLIVIGYGMFIPTNGRRCAAMTISGTIVMLLVAVLLDRLRGPTAPRLFGMFIAEMCVPYAIAIGFSVFGSNRMERLRLAVRESLKLGQYQLQERIGAGGMGEVYRAVHRLLKRPCAIKMIRPEYTFDANFVRRFEREVAAVTQLRHPASVQVYDYGQSPDGGLYYVMEYLSGQTLDHVVRRSGPMPPARAIAVLRQLCGALAEAHALKLIHRDVKPGNVMLCRLGGRNDAVKLLDFGLVADLKDQESRMTQAGNLLGTPAYMSPEQAGGRDVGPSSDLYSLGGVAYFLLTGHPPFPGNNPLQLLHAHQMEAVKPLRAFDERIPPDLESIVLTLLAKSPADRFPSSLAVDTALAAVRNAGEWTDSDSALWWDEFSRSDDPAVEVR